MNILVAANDGYIFPTKVMLMSLLDVEEEKETFQVYVLCSELSEKSIGELNGLNSDRMRINYLRVPDELFENVPVYQYFSKEVYYRIIAYKLLPDDMDRIMWIDGDIVIIHSISKFYYQNIDDSMIVAIEDMLNGRNEEKKKKLNIPTEKLYFSSGVMLYNLSRMRDVMDIDHIFNYIHNNKDVIEIVDQDVLNALYYNQTKVIEKGFKYNYFVGELPAKGEKSILEKISILHYCGSKKPWKKGYPYHGFEFFWKYAMRINKDYCNYPEIKNSYFISHSKWLVKGYIKRILRYKKK